MPWKAFFFLHNHDTYSTNNETGFKAKRPPPHISVLDEFEDNMLNMIQRVQFKTNCAATDSLQAKLDKDVQEIEHDENMCQSQQNYKPLQA